MKIVVVLLFVTQSLSPFLHAHAGVSRPASGAPLHLHLLPGKPVSTAVAPHQHSLTTDEGRLVVVPPEVRREGALSVVEQQTFLPVFASLVFESGRHHELVGMRHVPRESQPAQPAHARGPPD